MEWGGVRWCAHPRLHVGESFSSWLHRSAQANGISDHSFCRQVFGERASWNRDLDRFGGEQLLHSASLATGENLERLRSGVLGIYVGTLFKEFRTAGELHWVLPMGIRGRKRTAFGQQYCPACLGSREPWLRLMWRLAWVTVCSEHQVLLHDCCTNCSAPISLRRLSSHPVRGFVCSVCGYRLAGTGVPARQAEVRFQRRLERALRANTIEWFGQDTASLDIFTGLRALMRGLYTNSHGSGLIELMPSAMFRRRPRSTAMGFEHWRIEKRRYAMGVLRYVLADWPDPLLSQALEHRIYRSRFDDGHGSVQPRWLELGLRRLERPIPNLVDRAYNLARRKV